MRELVILGTASQAPTRYRNHNGYFLRWDDQGILFDPGEGTQRQMLLAGVKSSSVTRICITHFHGDHCLGLPGVIQRMSLDELSHPVDLCFPASGGPFVERLTSASVFEEHAEVRLRPVAHPGLVDPGPPFELSARRLRHEPETLGWRIEEPAGRTMIPERLEALGVRGPAVGALQRRGWTEGSGGDRVSLDQVSEVRNGQVMAFVMDTGMCDEAFALAEGADLLVCEATFASADADLARRYNHLTASEAGRLAADSGVRRLVITHFSQRYPDATVLRDEAAGQFSEVVCAEDLMRVPVPARRQPGSPS